MARIVAVCISKSKGTRKRDIKECRLIENHGLEGDAHAGKWHRQVSLLAAESIERFNAQGFSIDCGGFGENLTTEGIDLISLPVGTKLNIGEGLLLEVTQIGKVCHRPCAIFRNTGDCILPREGIFAAVLKGGIIKVGDEISIIERPDSPKEIAP